MIGRVSSSFGKRFSHHYLSPLRYYRFYTITSAMLGGLPLSTSKCSSFLCGNFVTYAEKTL
ncbi:hypothetical protein APHNP_0361 [Anaplasma phagocytophilum str. ApNP]|uniref:Uncharacterized protein n=2 Tax=Anaplasma phagocytophilum TaxID=948 RepID=A0A0F3NG67_ANAPH|nr:hypothetical protein APHMUC_0572 [Anaplasma phagocytophilum str. ApMUC09]KJV66687.1 hypothetical protein APHNP_0361 [Anaplasma phagocytophilum str. ApNP]